MEKKNTENKRNNKRINRSRETRKIRENRKIIGQDGVKWVTWGKIGHPFNFSLEQMGRFFECYIKWRQHLQYYSFILTEKLVIYFPGDPLFPILPYEIEEAEEDVQVWP